MLGLGVGFYKLSGNDYPHGRWTPKEIPSLIHWYSKGIGQTSREGDENVNCQVWRDQKGSNHLQADASDDAIAPTLNEDGTITFDAAGDIMQFDSAIGLGTFSVYVRLSYSDAISADYLFEKFNSAQDFFQLSTEAVVKVKINNNGRHDYAIVPVFPEDGTPFNVGLEREDTHATTNDIVRVYHGGTSMTQSGNGDGLEPITELFEIGSIGKPAQTSTWHEIVICSDALSTADRVLLNTYLDSI